MQVNPVATLTSFIPSFLEKSRIEQIASRFLRTLSQAPPHVKYTTGIFALASVLLLAIRFFRGKEAIQNRKIIIAGGDNPTIRNALMKLPVWPLIETIYVFPLQNQQSYVWFEGDGKFAKYRNLYASNYQNILLLGIPVSQEVAKQMHEHYFDQCCNQQPWLGEFIRTKGQDFVFPGHYVALTYEEYAHIVNYSSPPPRLAEMFRKNKFPPAWPFQK